MPRKPTRGHQPARPLPDRDVRVVEPKPSVHEDSHGLREKEQKGRPGYGRVDPKTAPPKR